MGDSYDGYLWGGIHFYSWKDYPCYYAYTPNAIYTRIEYPIEDGPEEAPILFCVLVPNGGITFF